MLLHRKRFKLVSRVFGFLALLALSSGAAVAQVVALGASNVAGYGVSGSEAFPARIEAMLHAKGYNVTVSNAGVSGDTSAGILSRVDSAVPRGTRVVLLGVYGFNDQRHGVSQAEHNANVAAIVSRIHSLGAKIITADLSGLPRQPDGIHLTADGHAMLAARLLPRVIAALGRPR
jgi:acyl-CoA thioesterase I